MTVGDVGAAYDARAQEYVELFGRVDQHPVADQDLVSRWRDSTSGLLLDAGCGPGAWLEILRDGGRQVLGADLSEQFLTVGRSRHPSVPFLRGSLAALPLRSGTLGGVLAWYSIIHTPPDALPVVLAELRRVLRPDGSLLLGFVDGHPGQSFDHSVITAYYWSVDAMSSLLGAAGFEVVAQHRRPEEGRRHRRPAALIARAADL